MNCDECRALIHEQFRGNLSAERESELQGHRAGCSACSDYTTALKELTCKEFVDFLHAYIDSELSPERMAVFDRHLAVCPDCRFYIEGYRRTMSLSVKAMEQAGDGLRGEIPEDLLRAILEAREEPE